MLYRAKLIMYMTKAEITRHSNISHYIIFQADKYALPEIIKQAEREDVYPPFHCSLKLCRALHFFRTEAEAEQFMRKVRASGELFKIIRHNKYIKFDFFVDHYTGVIILYTPWFFPNQQEHINLIWKINSSNRWDLTNSDLLNGLKKEVKKTPLATLNNQVLSFLEPKNDLQIIPSD